MRSTSQSASLSHRDRAVLRAVAAGRCAIAEAIGLPLVVDGLVVSDQQVGPRLVDAGLIVGIVGPARLTDSGRSALAAA